MKKFIITLTDFNFLMKQLADLNLDSKVERIDEKQNKLILELTEAEQDQLVDGLSSLLVTNGLDENDEPNLEGLMIERLIDVFNPYKNNG